MLVGQKSSLSVKEELRKGEKRWFFPDGSRHYNSPQWCFIKVRAEKATAGPKIIKRKLSLFCVVPGITTSEASILLRRWATVAATQR